MALHLDTLTLCSYSTASVLRCNCNADLSIATQCNILLLKLKFILFRGFLLTSCKTMHCCLPLAKPVLQIREELMRSRCGAGENYSVFRGQQKGQM